MPIGLKAAAQIQREEEELAAKKAQLQQMETEYIHVSVRVDVSSSYGGVLSEMGHPELESGLLLGKVVQIFNGDTALTFCHIVLNDETGAEELETEPVGNLLGEKIYINLGKQKSALIKSYNSKCQIPQNGTASGVIQVVISKRGRFGTGGTFTPDQIIELDAEFSPAPAPPSKRSEIAEARRSSRAVSAEYSRQGLERARTRRTERMRPAEPAAPATADDLIADGEKVDAATAGATKSGKGKGKGKTEVVETMDAAEGV